MLFLILFDIQLPSSVGNNVGGTAFVHQWNDPAFGGTVYIVRAVWNPVLYASFNILLDVYYIQHYHIMDDSTKYIIQNLHITQMEFCIVLFTIIRLPKTLTYPDTIALAEPQF